MSKKRYLPGASIAANELGLDLFAQQSQIPNKKSIDPCMISPNITPKKNGNEIMLKTVGFTSL